MHEETANVITHAVGIGLSIAALIVLLVWALNEGNIWNIVSYSIYGSSLILLYTASTIYHSMYHEKAKKICRIIDHSAIFLLIAGTYTPITLGPLRGSWGWSLFGISWGLALAGIIFKLFFTHKSKVVSVIIYIVMGWMAVIAIKPMIENMNIHALVWLLIGGGAYSLGTVFYLWKKLPFNHAIWHLFVMGGSISHFFAILLYT